MICESENSWSSVVVVFVSIKSARLLSRSCSRHHNRRKQAHTDTMAFDSLRLRTPSSCELGFNANYLFWLGCADVFMSPEEIVDWINSVSSYLQDWYDDVLSKPENKLHLEKVRTNVDAFVKDMHDATQEQHKLARQDGKLVYCPSHNLLSAKSSGLRRSRLQTLHGCCCVLDRSLRYPRWTVREPRG